MVESHNSKRERATPPKAERQRRGPPRTAEDATARSAPSSTGAAVPESSRSAGPGARPATPIDQAFRDKLLEEARAELVELRGGRLLVGEPYRNDPGPHQRSKRTAGPGSDDRGSGGGDRATFVGTYDGAPVGLAEICAVSLNGVRVAVFEVLYVEPEARGVGVGEALVDQATAWAVEQGCDGSDVVVLPGSRATKSFLEGAGFKARLIVMHRPSGG